LETPEKEKIVFTMPKITLIADPKVLAMPIVENNEPLVDIIQYPQIILSKKDSCPYQKAPSYSKVRKTVADLLVQAAKYLPKGIQFYLEEGHRSLSVQKIIFDEYYQKLLLNHPNWDKETLFCETTKYVAPPERNAPHSTGGAIDISLVTESGEKIDMGPDMNETPDQNQNRNFTYASNISAAVKANRKILIETLTRFGFVNYPTEWWHWSFGDRYWAYHAKKEFALYGSIEA
jgi:D-alanyl-D-alanine dipeptidase